MTKLIKIIEKNRKYIIIFISLVMAPYLGSLITEQGWSLLQRLFTSVIALFLVLLVLQKPYLGLAFTLASLPLQSTLPPIPLFTSVVSLLGALTLGAYLWQQRQHPVVEGGLHQTHLWALLFIFWIIVSNPEAALPFREGRSWAFTYIQLWMIMWLAGKLLTTERLVNLIKIFLLATCLSAGVALSQAQIGSSLSDTVRAEGLVKNANGFALNLVMAFTFTVYLHSRSQFKKTWTYLSVYVLLTVSILLSFSRAGMMAFAIALALLWLFGDRLDASIKGKSSRTQIALLFGVLSLAMLALVPLGYGVILDGLLLDVQTGGGTVGARYALWDSAWRIWLDNPVAGVGIGYFDDFNASYIDSLFIRFGGAVAHNMYLTLLSETGIIGLILFLGWLGSAFWSLWVQMQKTNLLQPLALTILASLAAISVFGLTHSSQYSKILWLLIGSSIALHSAGKSSRKDMLLDGP